MKTDLPLPPSTPSVPVQDTEPAFTLQVRAAERTADPLVSVLLPAYNEEGNVVPMLDTLHTLFTGLGLRHELIVIDDGSRDATVERVMGVVDRLPVTLIQLSRNFGKEAALTAGIDHVPAENLTGLITKGKLDAETLDDIEEALIVSDLGPATAAQNQDRPASAPDAARRGRPSR